MEIFQAAGIVGLRQVGKTTLVKNISWAKNKIYLDLEKASDRAKLGDVELFLTNHQDNTVTCYLEFLEGSFMVRILQPYHRNFKKRLVKILKERKIINIDVK